jgi:hypothetical protein
MSKEVHEGNDVDSRQGSKVSKRKRRKAIERRKEEHGLFGPVEEVPLSFFFFWCEIFLFFSPLFSKGGHTHGKDRKDGKQQARKVFVFENKEN